MLGAAASPILVTLCAGCLVLGACGGSSSETPSPLEPMIAQRGPRIAPDPGPRRERWHLRLDEAEEEVEPPSTWGTGRPKGEPAPARTEPTPADAEDAPASEEE